MGNPLRYILSSLTILWLTLSASHAAFPVGDHAVIIRIDDIQDYGSPSPYALPEKMVLQYHIDNRIPALISIIPARFGKDPQLIDQIKEGITLGIFTVGIHGWLHEPFDSLSQDMQTAKMRYGKSRLEEVLGTKVLAFVPPYAKFNNDTIRALARNGLTLMSSSIYEGDIPREEDDILFIPQTVTTAEADPGTDTWTQLQFESITRQIEESWASYGAAILVIHPRQFIDESGDDRWKTYVQVIEWIQANDGEILRREPSNPKEQLNFNPFMISVGIFAGMVSTLLVAFKVSSKRKDKKSRY